MHRSMICAGMLLALAACKPTTSAPAGSISVADAEKVAAAAEASFTSGDVARIMGHYGKDAVVFDPGTNVPTRDPAKLTEWTKALVAMQPRNYSPGKRIIQPLGPDSFISSGLSSIDVLTGAGMQTVHLRYTDVFRKQADGQWRIVHEHNSALPLPSAAVVPE